MRTRPSLRADPPPPIELATSAYLSGLFAPITDELDVDNLTVDGTLPADLDGCYIRNGPNPRFTPLGGFLYPLDGDGMLHRVRIREGRAQYTNRFVRTPALLTEEAAGRALWTGIISDGWSPGADLVGTELAHTVKDLPSINVVRHAGRLLAMAESCNPFRASNDLSTWTRETFDGAIPQGVTAHPKIDPITGEMAVFCYSLHEPYLTWSLLDREGRAVKAAVPVPGIDRSIMVHDMALTTHYLVLILCPLFFTIAAARTPGGSPLSWEPEQGTRIALIPRGGGPVKWVQSEPFWVWHSANALEVESAGGAIRVVVDYVRWDAPAGLGGSTVTPAGSLSRLTLDPTSGTARHETLADRNKEFPRVDDRQLTRAHTSIGTVLDSGSQRLVSGDSDALGWYHTADQRFETWAAPELAFGEQTFVPKPGDPDTDCGWWTTIATSRETLTSRLLIIPAADPTSGPIATVHLPHRVPLGLHGSWLPTEE